MNLINFITGLLLVFLLEIKKRQYRQYSLYSCRETKRCSAQITFEQICCFFLKLLPLSELQVFSAPQIEFKFIFSEKEEENKQNANYEIERTK